MQVEFTMFHEAKKDLRLDCGRSLIIASEKLTGI